MQIHFLALLIIGFVSGCAGQDYGADTASSRPEISSEEAGWSRLETLAASECGATPSPPERERAVEMSNCVTGLVREHVLPYSAMPELLLHSRAQALYMAKDYAAGRLSPVEYRKRSEARLKIYRNSMIYLGHQRRQAAG